MRGRFTFCTLNLWEEQRWPEREPALRRFLELHQPDVLCVQELRPVTRELIDEVLVEHRRVDDPHPGFAREGNIYWHGALFEQTAHGGEDVGIVERDRRLFWVRLRPRAPASEPASAAPPELLVATAHFTWPGSPQELDTGVNPRIGQARRTAEALDRLGRGGPVLFAGDLNGSVHPVRTLERAGYLNVFRALGRVPAHTYPTVPSALAYDKARASRTIDWIVYAGPLRPMSCEVVDFFANDIAPSDHKPVLATFRLDS